VLNVAMLMALSWFGVRFSGGKTSLAFWLFASCLLVVSRPGHITLFTGYFTAQMVIGTAMALHFARSRPWVAAVGILLASFKPNFVLPLLLLMVARRDFGAVIRGTVLAGVFAVGGLAWLAADSSVAEVVQGFREGQEALHNDPTELPENRWTRVDISGMVARVLRTAPGDVVSLAAMVAVLAVPGIVLWRAGRHGYEYGATGASGMLIVLAVLLSIHHHSYDCLLLAVPWIGFAFFGTRVAPHLAPATRLAVSVLTAVPAANYLSTLTFQQKLGLDADGPAWIAITLVNGACLTAALIVLLVAHRGSE
jgi:hypothetical protein